MKYIQLCLFFLLSCVFSTAQISGRAAGAAASPVKGSSPFKSATRANQLAKKILLDSNMIVDFSGAWGRAAYSTFHYFDSKADPRSGDLLADSTTGNTSIGAEDYYGYRPHRLIGGNFQQ